MPDASVPRDASVPGPDASVPPPRFDAVIHAARAFDGVETVIAPASIGLQGQEIAYVGPRLTTFEADETIDLSSGTVLPGLLDSHVHLGNPSNYEAQLARYLAVGVTAVRDLGGSLLTVSIRDQIEAGELALPTVYAAGPHVTAPEGHPASTIYAGLPESLVSQLVRTPTTTEAAIQVIDELHEIGVDVIKAVSTSGSGSLPAIDPDVLRALVERAAEVGLTVTVHTDAPSDLAIAVEAGAFGVEHGVSIADFGALDVVRAAGAIVTPTLGICRAVASDPSVCKRLTAPAVRAWREGDLMLAVGTDTEVPGLPWPVEDYVRELEAFAADGFTSLEVLRIATSETAKALRSRTGAAHIETAGTLTVGKRADLLAVEGDPTLSLADLRQVTHVWLGGELLVRP